MAIGLAQALRIERALEGYAVTPEDEADPVAAAERLWSERLTANEDPGFALTDLVAWIAGGEGHTCEGCGHCCG